VSEPKLNAEHDSDDDRSVTGLLTRFSLDRRITVLVFLMTIVVVGVIASLGIPLETFPRGFEFPAVQVSVPWKDAPAQAVMDKITLPLEEELSTVRNLDGLNSWTRTGNTGVFVRFKQGTDMDVAYREVRDRVERARMLFPEDVDRTFIFKQDMSGIPLLAIGVAVDPDIRDYYNLIQKEIVLPLSRIDGVASVDAQGLIEKEVLIEIDKGLSDAHGLNIYQLGQDLGGDNFTMASGTVRDAGKKFLLRSVATYKSIEELEDRPVSPTARLKDIATISYAPPDYKFAVRVNGKQAFALIVKKEGDANTVDVCREVRVALDKLKDNPRLGSSVEMAAFFDQGLVIEDSLSNLIKSGRLGGLLAAAVLFIFLRQVRLTAIISLSIPLCLLVSLVVMFFMGETLNILSILGLVICVGLLVDNSVVVAENILRLRNAGLTRRDACVRGASEIALAITLATLTTVAVFLPMSLVEGQGKFFMMRLAIPICVSLLASLLVALIFIPLSVYITFPARMKKGPSQGKPGFYARLMGWIEVVYEFTFGKIKRVYNLMLAFFLRRRLDLVFGLFVVFWVTVFVAWKEVGLAESQEEDQMSLNIGIQMDKEFTFEETGEYFREVERIVEARKEEYGLSGYFVQYRKRGGRFEAWLDKDVENDLTAKEIGSKIYKELPKSAGVRLYYAEENQAEDAKGKDVFGIRLEGDDPTLLAEVAETLEPVFLRVDGVLGMRAGEDETPSELALVIDRDRATASGVNPNTIAGVVGYALRGSALPRFNQDGKQIPVRVRFQESDRETLSDLSNFQVPTESGGALPISALTDAKMLNTPQGINRRDRRVTHYLTFELEEGKAEEARETMIAMQQAIDLPEGVRFGAISMNFNNEDLDSMKFAGVMSILFVYLLMGFLFESFILPLSIILTIPLAGIGVGWIHYITDKDMDMLGIIGIILLIGVVVNNGIVLIDYVNRLRREGMERTKALLQAADRRFRPILMTALTTIIGMLPLTVSDPSAIGMSYKSFGLTLIGGMTTATLLTLLVIPVFYTFFDDARIAAARALRRALPRRAKNADAKSTEAAPVEG
jgi:HAE1 family hydrophobic/amphiphilic exporter-1